MLAVLHGTPDVGISSGHGIRALEAGDRFASVEKVHADDARWRRCVAWPCGRIQDWCCRRHEFARKIWRNQRNARSRRRLQHREGDGSGLPRLTKDVLNLGPYTI